MESKQNAKERRRVQHQDFLKTFFDWMPSDQMARKVNGWWLVLSPNNDGNANYPTEVSLMSEDTYLNFRQNATRTVLPEIFQG